MRIINFQQFLKTISQSLDFKNIHRPYANSSHFFILRLKCVLSGAKIKCRPRLRCSVTNVAVTHHHRRLRLDCVVYRVLLTPPPVTGSGAVSLLSRLTVSNYSSLITKRTFIRNNSCYIILIIIINPGRYHPINTTNTSLLNFYIYPAQVIKFRSIHHLSVTVIIS